MFTHMSITASQVFPILPVKMVVKEICTVQYSTTAKAKHSPTLVAIVPAYMYLKIITPAVFHPFEKSRSPAVLPLSNMLCICKKKNMKYKRDSACWAHKKCHICVIILKISFGHLQK